MAGFRRANREQINIFEIDERYLFKHYFDDGDVFDRVKPYYNSQKYRFEVPASEFPDLQSFLEDHGYGPVVVDIVPAFAVVVEKYTAHPENIPKDIVLKRSVDSYNCFLMVDQAAVEQAVDDGAVRLTDTDFANSF